MEKITVFKTDYHEVEELIKNHYGINYEIVPAEELSNGTSLDYDIDGESDSWDVEDFEEMKKGKWKGWQTNSLMNKLCADGFIEPGNYIIDCSW